MGNIIHFDQNHNRRHKNAQQISPLVDGLSLIDVGTIKDVMVPGVETLLFAGDYSGVIFNAVGVEYREQLEIAMLVNDERGQDSHFNLVLLGPATSLENLAAAYGISVINTSNGYLEEHHLPELQAVMDAMSQE